MSSCGMETPKLARCHVKLVEQYLSDSCVYLRKVLDLSNI